jgi:hypothetical protein
MLDSFRDIEKAPEKTRRLVRQFRERPVLMTAGALIVLALALSGIFVTAYVVEKARRAAQPTPPRTIWATRITQVAFARSIAPDHTIAVLVDGKPSDSVAIEHGKDEYDDGLRVLLGTENPSTLRIEVHGEKNELVVAGGVLLQPDDVIKESMIERDVVLVSPNGKIPKSLSSLLSGQDFAVPGGGVVHTDGPSVIAVQVRVVLTKLPP